MSDPAVSFAGGSLTTALPELNLGSLQLNEYTGFSSRQPRISFPTNHSTIRFSASHHLSWHPETTLWIMGWKGNLTGAGNHRLHIGTSRSLTSHQLARLRFDNPSGLPSGTYFAQQLPTGEIVPSQDWYVEFTRRDEEMIFRWDFPWRLEFSTTPQGPYQPLQLEQNSYTSPYSGNSGFFRLRKSP